MSRNWPYRNTLHEESRLACAEEGRAGSAGEGSAEPGKGRPATALLDTLSAAPHPAPIRGQYTPDLYSRKSEYTEKAASTGPFL